MDVMSCHFVIPPLLFSCQDPASELNFVHMTTYALVFFFFHFLKRLVNAFGGLFRPTDQVRGKCECIEYEASPKIIFF